MRILAAILNKYLVSSAVSTAAMSSLSLAVRSGAILTRTGRALALLRPALALRTALSRTSRSSLPCRARRPGVLGEEMFTTR